MSLSNPVTTALFVFVGFCTKFHVDVDGLNSPLIAALFLFGLVRQYLAHSLSLTAFLSASTPKNRYSLGFHAILTIYKN